MQKKIEAREQSGSDKRLLSGFTLIELLIVLIIVGILAGLSVPTYTRTRERALDREARTALSFIQAAERMYRLRDTAFYGPETDLDIINDNLQLSLASGSWIFAVTTANVSTFIARATRNDGSRIWQIDQADAESCCIGSGCPPNSAC